MRELPQARGKYFLKEGEWHSVSTFEDKGGSYGDIKYKGIVTDRYSVIFEERKKKIRPVGFEPTLYDNVGESIPDDLYRILISYKNPPLIVTNRQFDSGRNVDTLLRFLPYPTSYGVVSGRKPSGPCHFGHKLVVSTCAFLQQNGAQIFMPIADLEASLDPKIKNKKQYEYLAADNLLDWGACGLDLDAAHVYLQSEEIRVMNLGYMAARGLTFDIDIDIYGRETMVDEFPFLFASITQVGDIILPQHPDFGKKHSFMLSGADQDGNMSMTMALAKAAIERGSEYVKNIPSSLYVRSISNLEGKKESASEPETTIYLGPSRNVYLYSQDGRKHLERIDKLSLEERITDVCSKIDKFKSKDESKVLQSIQRRQLLFQELYDENPLTIGRFKTVVANIIKDHQKRRKDVYEYALLKTLREYDASQENLKRVFPDLKRVLNIIERGVQRNLSHFDYDAEPIKPTFWNTPSEAYVPEEKKKVTTRWYHQIARMADELIL
jgi:tryptophanyl-tRNA synthetase